MAREPKPGDRPLPTTHGLVEGTATLLITYFAWDATYGSQDLAVLRGYLANAFVDLHGGYPISRIAIEVRGSEMLDLTLKTGSIVVNDYAAWADEKNVTEEARMYLVAIDRSQALETENHWYTRIFRYQPPRLGFSKGQKEMLLLARQGLTDRQIAEQLSLSLAAIKKRWESIYGRFYERLPGVLTFNSTGRRGTEKRRLVLAHLHERLEELRP